MLDELCDLPDQRRAPHRAAAPHAAAWLRQPTALPDNDRPRWMRIIDHYIYGVPLPPGFERPKSDSEDHQ